MGDELFRKSALDKLASPERLDVLMQVTSPQGWAALWALGVVLVGAIAWSIFGSFPERVDGSGILTLGGGLQRIVANGDGTLTRLDLTQGMKVTENQVVGEISVGGGVQISVTDSQEALENLQASTEQADRTDQLAIGGKQQNILQLQADIKNLEAEQKTMSDEVASKKHSLTLGYITQRDLDDAQAQLINVGQQIGVKRASITSENQGIGILNQQIRSRDDNLQNQQRRTTEAKTTASEIANITSTVAGEVTAVNVRKGDPIHSGEEIARIEPLGSAFEAIVYVSTAGGKRVTPGMEAQISPAGIRREDYGFMLGTVSDVGQYSATESQMLTVLGDGTSVKNILENGSVFEVHITPKPASTPTGYAWSSGEGPLKPIDFGGLPATVSVIVDRHAPIKEVLPFLKKAAGAS